MSEGTPQGQSGGVNISGHVGSVGGDIVGRDKIVGIPSAAALDDALQPVLEAIRPHRLRYNRRPRRNWRGSSRR
jgi:hypothetical protein